uniref:Uncharacterized protein n=1 Tax=Cannabis sativa TaxID=3483 RepID=A0A803QNT8_CANSA
MFLARLKVEFDKVRRRIISRQPLPPIGEVFSEVRREESRRSVMLGKKVIGIVVKCSSFAIVGGIYGRNINYSPKYDEKLWLWCDFCNKSRHTLKTCWKIHGKSWKGKAERPGRAMPMTNEVETSPFTKEQLDHLYPLLKTSSTSPGIPTVF